MAEATLILDRLKDIVAEFHRHGLFLFTWGDVNNEYMNYAAQKSYGVDGIILDDVARVAKVRTHACCGRSRRYGFSLRHAILKGMFSNCAPSMTMQSCASVGRLILIRLKLT